MLVWDSVSFLTSLTFSYPGWPMGSQSLIAWVALIAELTLGCTFPVAVRWPSTHMASCISCSLLYVLSALHVHVRAQ